MRQSKLSATGMYHSCRTQEISKLPVSAQPISNFYKLVQANNIQYFRRIQAIKKADFLGIFLFCDNAYESHEGWSIQTEVTFNLVSTNGHNYKQAAMLKFEKAGGQGITEFIKWDNVIETYFNPLKDNLIVEAHVKVYFIKGLWCFQCCI